MSANTIFTSGYHYDHVGTEDSDHGSWYHLRHVSNDGDYLNSDANYRDTNIPESDITTYAAHADRETSNESGNIYQHTSPEIYNTEKFSIPKISRKPVPTATVHSLKGHDSSESDRGTVQEQRKPRSLLQIWWLEALACLLVLLALLSMVVTVYAYKGQPLPKWKYGITIGSLLAIYSTIFRAAGGYILSEGLGQLKWSLFKESRPLQDLNVYDESSRGPWGCMQLLASSGGLRLIARLGALATLTLLILDPFTQQLLGYETLSISITKDATLPRTRVFYGNGIHIWTGFDIPEANMQAAANAGLYGVNATQVTPNCKTGNCTFDTTFNTVGYCHRCYDVTSQVVITETSHNYTTTETGENVTSTVVTSIVTLQQGQDNIINMTVGTSGSVDWAMLGQAFDQENENYSGLLVRNYSFTFLVPGRDTGLDDARYANTGAFQCNLEMCVRTMKANINLGVLEEGTLSTYSNWGGVSSSANYTRSMIDLDCLDNQQQQLLAKAGYQYSSTDRFIPYNGSLLSNGTLTPGNTILPFGNYTSQALADEFAATIPARCVYTMAATYSDGLQNFFHDLFNGSMLVPGQEDFGQYGSTSQGSSVLNNLYGRGADLNAFNDAMSNIANSVTSQMRQTSVQNLSDPVHGSENASLSCVKPMWPWIIYNVFVAGIILVFFVVMVWETGVGPDKWRHDFKSSSLATMCAGLDADTRDHLVATVRSGRSRDLQAVASNTPVRFVRRDVKFTHQD